MILRYIIIITIFLLLKINTWRLHTYLVFRVSSKFGNRSTIPGVSVRVPLNVGLDFHAQLQRQVAKQLERSDVRVVAAIAERESFVW